MANLEAGTTLKSRYTITEQLGKGGMGEVYLATDESLDTQVAVKANHNLSTHTAAQFIREARLLASLKHPNLPRVIDYFTDEESQYLVMDYVPGNDLKQLIEGGQAISLPQVMKWATQLGNALTYLHSQNPPIYHRDIKPANIKLTPSGEVVLVDFGIAKTGDASTETQTGAWAFSPGFAPPEQVSGMRTGPYSDQFSLAATLYYLLTGKPPADSARRLMGEEEYVPLIATLPNLPVHFSQAMDRALLIKPEARFANVAEFIEALTNPVQAAQVINSQSTVVASSRPSAPPVMPPAAVVATPAPAKKKSALWAVLGIIAIVGVLIGGYFVLSSTGVIGAQEEPSPTRTQQVAVAPTKAPTEEPAATATQTITAVTATETAAPTEAPSTFSPLGNGGRVAFVSDRQSDGYQQIWLMEVGINENKELVAQNYKQLTFTPSDKSNPSWSPDGSKIIYSGLSTGFSPNGTPFANDIFMIDLANLDQEPVDLTMRPGDDLYAAWSPSNKYIAFTSYYREDKTPQLVVMNPDGSDQQLLSILGFSDTYATWSPNGDWLLYTFSTGQLDVLQMIYHTNITKKTPRVAEDFNKFDRSSNEGRLGNVLEPSVSFDGSVVVYTQAFNDKKNIATAIFADRGRTVTRLTDSGLDYSPCWSPDNKWILFTSERDGDSEIYIMDANGGQVTNLTQLPSVDKDPSWQPPKY